MHEAVLPLTALCRLILEQVRNENGKMRAGTKLQFAGGLLLCMTPSALETSCIALEQERKE